MSTPRKTGESFGAICRKFSDAAVEYCKNPTDENFERLAALEPEYTRLRTKFLAAAPGNKLRIVKDT